MNQKHIRYFNDKEFSIAEAALWHKEFNDRTKSNQKGYNSIDELATQLKTLETGTSSLINKKVLTLEYKFGHYYTIKQNDNLLKKLNKEFTAQLKTLETGTSTKFDQYYTIKQSDSLFDGLTAQLKALETETSTKFDQYYTIEQSDGLLKGFTDKFTEQLKTLETGTNGSIDKINSKFNKYYTSKQSNDLLKKLGKEFTEQLKALETGTSALINEKASSLESSFAHYYTIKQNDNLLKKLNKEFAEQLKALESGTNKRLIHYYTIEQNDDLFDGITDKFTEQLQTLETGTNEFIGEKVSSLESKFDSLFDKQGNLHLKGNIKRKLPLSGFLEGDSDTLGFNFSATNPIYTLGANYNPLRGKLKRMTGIGYAHGNSARFIPFNGGLGLYVACGGEVKIFLDGDTGNINSSSNIIANKLMFSKGHLTKADKKLMANIEPLDGYGSVPVLPKIARLNPIYYKWKGRRSYNSKKQIGFIAGEIKKNFPELVENDGDYYGGHRSYGDDNLYYDRIGVIAIKGIQELYNEVLRLKDKINS